MAAHSTVGIFNDALSISLAERPAFLERACGGDSRLIAEIASLLAVHDAALDSPAPEVEFPEMLPGSRLGTFVVLREIGRGGMGIVYLAEDSRLRRRLAIKTLSSRLGEEAPRLARLEREAQVLASLNHPNISILYSLEESDGICYLVLEFVEGRTLSEELRSGPMSISRTLHLCRQIAAGLSSAHEHGVVHRDLKPSNVMVTPGSRVKLVDFGLAKVLVDVDREHSVEPLSDAPSEMMSQIDSSSGSPPPTPEVVCDLRTEWRAAGSSFTYGVPGGLVGTPGYMSPEQLRGLPVDHRADLWSFGCILYECLSGRPAFHAESISDRISATLEGDPDWTHLPVEVPESINAVLRACLSADPARRPASMHEVLPSLVDTNDVLPILTARPGSYPDNTALAPAAARARKRRSLMSAVLPWMLFGAAVIAAITLTGRSRVDPRPTPVLRQVSFDGNLVEVALSPDGRYAAYSTRGQEFVVRDLEGRTDTRRPLRGIASLEWSPSGNEILTALHPYPDSTVVRTMLVPAGGGEPRPLGPPGFIGHTWSPDGAKVAGLFRGVSGLATLAVFEVATEELASVPLDVPDGTMISVKWSPAGSHLLIETQQGWWILPVDGGISTRVLEEGYATWGARGESILYTDPGIFTDLIVGLFRLPIDPASGKVGAAVRICDLERGNRIAASRDGHRLFITRVWDFQLWCLRLHETDGEKTWIPLPARTERSTSPRISPEGHHVAYVEGSAGSWDLYTLSLLDGGKQRLTSLRAVFGGIAWSPDGREIAFQTGQKGSSERQIWTIGADGQELRRIETLSDPKHLSWVLDRGLLFQVPSDDRRNYHILDPASGKTSTVFADPALGTAFQARPSPDGTRIAVVGNRGPIADVRTWIVHLVDGSETLLWDEWAGPVGWSEDSRSVYVIAPTLGEPEGSRLSLFRVPAEGGDGELVADLPADVVLWSNVDVSSDGQTVVCTVREGPRDLWRVDNLRLEL